MLTIVSSCGQTSDLLIGHNSGNRIAVIAKIETISEAVWLPLSREHMLLDMSGVTAGQVVARLAMSGRGGRSR